MRSLEAGDPGRIGPYSIIGLLRSGDIGKVYLGRSAGGHLVAVNQVRPELAGDSRFRTRFREWVEQAKAVSGPFIAAVVNADVITYGTAANVSNDELSDPQGPNNARRRHS